MNKLPVEKQVAFLGCIVEGMGVRAACRIAGIAKAPASVSFAKSAQAAKRFSGSGFATSILRALKRTKFGRSAIRKRRTFRRISRRKFRDRFGWGDVWTWTALDSTSKLMITWRIGDRSAATGDPFIQDIADRVKGRIQLSTDGHAVYPQAVELAFAGNVDYATVVKEYASTPGNDGQTCARSLLARRMPRRHEEARAG